MPIVFEQPAPMGPGATEALGWAQGYAQAGGGRHGPANVVFPPTVPAPHMVTAPQQTWQDLEDPVDRQLRLDQGRLSQAEELRLQRLQAGLADVDEAQQNGSLTEDDANDLRLQIKTGIDPLARRRAQSALEAQQAQTQLLQNQAAQQEAIAQANMQADAKGLGARIREELDPGLLAQVTSEFDEANPEPGALEDYGLPDEDLSNWRQRAIRDRVAELGGATRWFLDRQRGWMPFDSGGGQRQAAVPRGAGPSGFSNSELGHHYDAAVKEVDAVDKATAPSESSGGVAAVQGREARIQQAYQRRLDAIRSTQTPPAPAVPWHQRGMPPGYRQQPAEAPRPVPDTAFAGAQERQALPADQQLVLSRFDLIRDNISRLPAGQERSRLYAELSRARDLYQAAGSTQAMSAQQRQEYQRLSSVLDQFSVRDLGSVDQAIGRLPGSGPRVARDMIRRNLEARGEAVAQPAVQPAQPYDENYDTSGHGL